MNNRNIARAAVLIAVCVVLGYVFLPIPNLEMITAGIFLAGIWMGCAYGLVIGFLAEMIFSLTNPMGLPMLPTLGAQVVGMSLAGFMGGFLRNELRNAEFYARTSLFIHIKLGCAGLLITTFFDLLTNLSFIWIGGLSAPVLLGAIPFVVVHVLVNTLTFALLIPIVLQRLPVWKESR
ncbi:MAG: ECF transporter S component [bacterium]